MTSEARKLGSPAEEVVAHHGHSCDGIQEYDNPLPGWWKGVFWATVVFSFCYLGFFHAGAEGRSVQERYQADFAANMQKKYKEIGELKADQATILKYMDQPEWVGVGAAIFKLNCVSCHRSDGAGNVGPNLCDDHFKHIKQVEDIAKVIGDGVAGGAMPAWKSRLGHPNDLVLVSAYVASLRGSNPKDGKAPDGNVIPPWPKSNAAP